MDQRIAEVATTNAPSDVPAPLPSDVDGGPEALSQLLGRLQNIEPDNLLEPKVQLSLVIDEARELQEILDRPVVRERLRGVGVAEVTIVELDLAIGALVESERRWCKARDAAKTARQAEAEGLGYALRDEMVAACRFNLSGVEVLELLARVTDGENPRDLVQDLLELSAFLRDNAAAFGNDTLFEPLVCSDEARELADAIAVDHEPDASALEHLELRDRAFTYLCERMQQLRQAGAYALRGSVTARRYFAPGSAPARRRRPLPSAVRALAG
jgi:hypothetical protein